MVDEVTSEVTALLQGLIRARCVNDGSPESGHEERAAAVLEDVLSAAGLDCQTHSSLPGRTSLITRIEGSDPSAPRLMLMGHTDVVPVNPDGWHHDPHGGELLDGWVWGRGAVDMLNITAAMAIAVARLARSGWRPRGSLILLAEADEEAGGDHGIRWLMDNHRDAVAADAVLTECGGVPVTGGSGGDRFWVTVGEKGVNWRRLTVHGTPSHGSRPLGSDNALVTAAQVVTRLAEYRPRAVITDVWRQWVDAMGFDADLAQALTDPDRIWQGIDELPPETGRIAHACTHLTAAPTMVRGGSKINIIPDRVEIDVDLRTLPGQGPDDADDLIRTALGEALMTRVSVHPHHNDAASASETGTALWETMARVVGRLTSGGRLVPALMTGGTDGRFYREQGVPTYGFGLFSNALPIGLWSDMFHGDNERVDQASLRLSVEAFEQVARDFLG